MNMIQPLVNFAWWFTLHVSLILIYKIKQDVIRYSTILTQGFRGTCSKAIGHVSSACKNSFINR